MKIKPERINMNIKKVMKPIALFAIVMLQTAIINTATAQVSAVKFGKNRIQYHKFNWRFYQTENFNVHFTQNGLELSKYVLQVAEEELPAMEAFTEISLQRRCNIILYNSYDDVQATNVGLGNDVQDVGGQTRLVNNKMVVYFNGNHEDLKRQIREGIAKLLFDTRLFGDNIGEFAGNAALLDLPKWLTDGYVSYAAENWGQRMDDELRSALLSGRYNNFYQFAFEREDIAGHAFWHYIATKYKKENVTYFMYLAILYKNLNSASQRICKKKFKDVLKDFMAFESDQYYKDLKGRRVYPKGTIAVTEEVDNNKDFFRFTPNPNKRLYTWAVAEYNKGRYNVVLVENYVNRKVLLGNGVRVYKHQKNPNYPIMAWDGKGSRLAYVYWENDKVWLQVYDIVNRANRVKQDLTPFFEQVQDMQYMLDANTLVFSAVKNGHTDLFVYKIDKQTVDQLTDDVWDDVDGAFVSFPNKYGVIFSSNRPTAEAKGGDTSIPSKNRYNVFLVDVQKKGGFRQITQLTKLNYGNARYPSQYNMNHFTFVSDESGIGNRYAGYFTTKAEGLDTLIIIGDEVLRNPPLAEIDSTLKVWGRSEPDSIGYIAVTSDSSYTFPLTNYQSSIAETRTGGEIGQVSEVTRQGDFKFLYRLKIDSLALRNRNVTARPTPYVKALIAEKKASEGKETLYQKGDTLIKKDGFFQTEFENEKPDSGTTTSSLGYGSETTLGKAKLYKYRIKYSMDQVLAGISNTILTGKYQPYGGGTGPIRLNNGNNLNFGFNATISDVMEDYRFSGGVQPGINFKDNQYYVAFENFRKRIDWGATYYHGASSDYAISLNGVPTYNAKLFTNIYQANVAYPLDIVRSVRVSAAYRSDKFVALASDRLSLNIPDQTSKFILTKAEYVYDNTINPSQNIWHGLRYKAFFEAIAEVTKESGQKRQFTFNFGFDARHYYPIYRNLIWAVRAAADVSWGNNKIIYYLGGTDGWLNPKFNDANRPAADQSYIYQTLAVNLRGFRQNVANGNNAFVINSEVRLPVIPTLVNRPINNAFLRNFQLVQFFDLGTAWNGKYNKLARPTAVFQQVPVTIKQKAGGIGPFAGGYGFGARSTLLGYFVKMDAAWEMNVFFKGKPSWYFSLGLDF
jgi:hypothetical protein